MIPAYSYLILSALGLNQPDMIRELSRSCLQAGCNLLNTKINVLGEDIAAFFFLSGNWSAIAKMEAALPALRKQWNLDIQTRRTNDCTPTNPLMTYNIQIIAIDRMGMLSEVSHFLQDLLVSVEEISVQTYFSHTNTRMVSMHLRINVPTNVHLATLREKIMSYCDDNNFDGFIEPLRNH